MAGVQLPYVPNADDALYTDFEGVQCNDPGPTEEEFNPANPTAKHFGKPVQDEILNLIRRTYALELSSDNSVRSQIGRSLYSIYLSQNFI